MTFEEEKNMEPIFIIDICFSIVGALLFIAAFIYELRIIKLLTRIKKGGKWIIATVLTGLFFFGYIANIYAVVVENVLLQSIFNAIVYLFGAIFLILVILISYSTYHVIFEAAEKDLGADLKLEKK
jgi:hypothetical protein